MEMVKKIALRLAVFVAFFFLCDEVYFRFFYQKDVVRYSRVKNRIDSAFAMGDIVYLGESSNTSFNPWTDTFSYSISDFLQAYIPDKKVMDVTHEGFHPGLFLQMLNLLTQENKPEILVMTVNMRTMGPAARFSGNESSNSQEALFYSKRPALLTRAFLSLHYYDNRSSLEMERLKFQYWRTRPVQNFHIKNEYNYNTALEWLGHVAASDRDAKWKQIADAYIKEFAWILTPDNPRVQDLIKMAKICREHKIRLIFHILPENREYAEYMFGKNLLNIMDANVNLLNGILSKYAVVVNNYNVSKGVQYTDQFYPTEHINAELRKLIAYNISRRIVHKDSKIELKANNLPNFNIKQPLADTLLKETGMWQVKSHQN